MPDVLTTGLDTIETLAALQTAIFGQHTLRRLSATQAQLQFASHCTVISTGKLPDGLFDRHVFERPFANNLCTVIVSPEQPRVARVGWFQDSPMHVVYAFNERRMRDAVRRAYHERAKRAAAILSLICHEVRHEQQWANQVERFRTFANTPHGTAVERVAGDLRKRRTPLFPKEALWEIDAGITTYLIEERCRDEAPSNWLDSAVSLLLS